MVELSKRLEDSERLRAEAESRRNRAEIERRLLTDMLEKSVVQLQERTARSESDAWSRLTVSLIVVD